MMGFSTNQGQTWQGVLMIALGAITTMDSGIERTVLLGIGLVVIGVVVIGVVAIFTRGSGLSAEEGQEIKRAVLENDEHRPPLKDVLREGRE